MSFAIDPNIHLPTKKLLCCSWIPKFDWLRIFNGLSDICSNLNNYAENTGLYDIKLTQMSYFYPLLLHGPFQYSKPQTSTIPVISVASGCSHWKTHIWHLSPCWDVSWCYHPSDITVCLWIKVPLSNLGTLLP